MSDSILHVLVRKDETAQIEQVDKDFVSVSQSGSQVLIARRTARAAQLRSDHFQHHMNVIG